MNNKFINDVKVKLLSVFQPLSMRFSPFCFVYSFFLILSYLSFLPFFPILPSTVYVFISFQLPSQPPPPTPTLPLSNPLLLISVPYIFSFSILHHAEKNSPVIMKVPGS